MPICRQFRTHCRELKWWQFDYTFTEVYWHIYASLGLNGFKCHCFSNVVVMAWRKMTHYDMNSLALGRSDSYLKSILFTFIKWNSSLGNCCECHTTSLREVNFGSGNVFTWADVNQDLWCHIKLNMPARQMEKQLFILAQYLLINQCWFILI